MTKTVNDVVTHALTVLKVVSSDRPVTPEELADGTIEYKAFHDVIMADLANSHNMRRRVWSYDSVPDNLMAHVAKMLAFEMIDMFPVNAETYQKVERGAMRAKSNLHAVLAKPKNSADRFPDIPVASKYGLATGTFNS